MSRNTDARPDPATLLLDGTTPGDNTLTEFGTMPIPAGVHRVQIIANITSDPATSFDAGISFTGITFDYLTIGSDSLVLTSTADVIGAAFSAIIRVSAGGTATVVAQTITDIESGCTWLGAVTVERVSEQ